MPSYGVEVEVTGPGTYVECSNYVVVEGRGSILDIKDGAVLHSLASAYFYGDATTGIQYGDLYNHVYVRGAGSKLHVSGNLNLSSPFATGQPGDPFHIPRPLPISLHINSGGTVVVGGNLSIKNSNLNLGVGGRLETASVLGGLTLGGTFAPGSSPADSVVDGLLSISSAGTLEMELGGYGIGNEHDRLTVTDIASLDGTLDIVLIDGFTLAYGDQFDLFIWEGGISEVNQEFSVITTNALSGNLSWDTSELYTTGTLSVIPEPASAIMLALAGGCGWFIRRFFMI
jgi:hypothetical protein